MLWTRTLDASPVGIVVVDARRPARPILHANAAFAALMSVPAPALKGRPAAELVGPAGPCPGLADIVASLEAGVPGQATVRAERPDGTAHWQDLRGVVVPGSRGQPQLWLLMVDDATDRMEQAARASAAEARLTALLHGIPAVVYCDRLDAVNGSLHCVYVSPPVEELAGYTPDELVADPSLWQRLVQPDDLQRAQAGKRDVAGRTFRREFRIRNRDGRRIWVRDEARVVGDEAGRPTLVQGVLTDITREREIEEALSFQANHDALTGLPNRVALRRALAAAVERSRLADAPAALLFMDLDAFKEVNDTLGHEVGDRLLAKVAQRLTEVVRGSDTVARLGGDEFAIVLPDTMGEEGARTVARHVTTCLEPPFVLDGRHVTIGASIGIALTGPDATDPETLMRLADVAMYRAKRTRTGVVCYDPEAGEEIVGTSGYSRLGELRTAIDQPQLELYYQPWLQLDTNTVPVAEALVRWHHPTQGLLMPADFLPLAEQSGLIRALDLTVLNLACDQVQRWRSTGRGPLRVAVNVSRASLLDEEFPTALAVALIRHRLEGPELELEITENGVLGDPDQAAWLAERLTALGVGLAIDDFGTGYSSLAQFRRLRASTLKIDRSFVATARERADDATICQSVIELGHRFGQAVVAEGVEDGATLELMQALGADFVQGYTVARPMPAAALESWLASRGWDRPKAALRRPGGPPADGGGMNGFDVIRPETPGYVPVPWSFLARLDEVPCDIFLRAGRRVVLYATTGTDPDSLRDRAARGVDLVVRQGDSYLLRRMLTVSLDRTLTDLGTPPPQRSKEAYEITASIVAQTFKMGRDGFDGDEASLVQETVDLLTRVMASDDETLWSMVASMQRQMTTHTHAINSAIYGLALAKSARIVDLDQLRDIGRGAVLMDIGLTTLPARIVDRPSVLDAQEARALRGHPGIGYSIVTRALGEAPSYAHMILEHHERLDGSGYPAGRKGNQLALDSQLVAIVDNFDALTSVRGDAAAMSPYEALQHLRFAMPGQFNDDLLRIFIELLGGWPGLRAAAVA